MTCKDCRYGIPDTDMGGYECSIDHGLRYGIDGCKKSDRDISADELNTFIFAHDAIANAAMFPFGRFTNISSEEINALAVTMVQDGLPGIDPDIIYKMYQQGAEYLEEHRDELKEKYLKEIL